MVGWLGAILGLILFGVVRLVLPIGLVVAAIMLIDRVTMPWWLLAMVFLFEIPAGFASFSKGFWFQGARGDAINGILSVITFGFIAWSFWQFGWETGFVTTVVVFSGSALGKHLNANAGRIFAVAENMEERP